MKGPLGTEVDLGLGHIVLPLRETGTELPSFRPMSIVATVAHLSCTAELVILSNRLATVGLHQRDRQTGQTDRLTV